MSYPIIDAHQHFWNYTPQRDAWITDEMKLLQQDYLPQHLLKELQDNGVGGCISVQAGQSEEENTYLLHHAATNDFIKGIVGWADLQSDTLEAQLTTYSQYQKIKGFRHILQGEAERDFMLRPSFKRGIGLLRKFNFTYDILIYPDQLKFCKELAAQFPTQLFVIDHLAKPYIEKGEINQWKKDIAAIATQENVFCKLSGFVTEADLQNWKPSDFTPYFDVITEAFTPGRIIYGSDWPVCLLGASYSQVLHIAKDYCSPLSESEQEQVFCKNAVSFYNLTGVY